MKYCLYVIAAFLFACNSQNDNQQKVVLSKKEVKKSLTNVNKTLVSSEDEDINDYISRHGWSMKKSPTGLRYHIYEKGKGEEANVGKLAVLNFELKLINDYICYSSEKDGVKKFFIGKNDEPKGLDEAVRLMKVGDKARIIVPSHLGYGLLGDQKEIPKKAVLIYDLELIDLK
jgi:FKBP-type peptidyl-prolyl cis-trans isomerase FkpA